MSSYALNVLSAVIILLGAISLVMSFNVMKKQEKKTRSLESSKTIAKHPIMLNPMLISYFLFPIMIVLGILIFYKFHFVP